MPIDYEENFAALTEAVDIGTRQYAEQHNVDPMLMAQALAKVALQVLFNNTQHPGQRMILEAILEDIRQALIAMSECDRKNKDISVN